MDYRSKSHNFNNSNSNSLIKRTKAVFNKGTLDRNRPCTDWLHKPELPAA